MLDEVGSALSHSDAPNAECVPIVCVHLEGLAFNVLWLREPVEHGQPISINRYPLRQNQSATVRSAHLYHHLSAADREQIESECVALYIEARDKLSAASHSVWSLYRRSVVLSELIG